MECPVCKLDPKYVTETPINGDRHDLHCARCGRFVISGSAAAMAYARAADYKLSAWIRSQDDTADPPAISPATFEAVASGVPNYKVSEKQLLFMRALERRTRFPGAQVEIATEFDFTLAWCSTREEFEYLIRSLLSRALVTLEKFGDPKDSFSLQLTISPPGWSFLEERASASVISNQVFVAMSFAEELLPAWKVGIEPAIKRAKFQPYRMDAHPHIDKVDNKIVAEIRNSRFLVADVTMQRAGVYFEAGFAIGLGLPVFWCVRDVDLQNVHFDTRQYNHIVWKTEEDLSQQLYQFIAAVVGRGTAASQETPSKQLIDKGFS